MSPLVIRTQGIFFSVSPSVFFTFESSLTTGDIFEQLKLREISIFLFSPISMYSDTALELCPVMLQISFSLNPALCIRVPVVLRQLYSCINHVLRHSPSCSLSLKKEYFCRLEHSRTNFFLRTGLSVLSRMPKWCTALV